MELWIVENGVSVGETWTLIQTQASSVADRPQTGDAAWTRRGTVRRRWPHRSGLDVHQDHPDALSSPPSPFSPSPPSTEQAEVEERAAIAAARFVELARARHRASPRSISPTASPSSPRPRPPHR